MKMGEMKAEFETLIALMKEVLGNKAEKVIMSSRLTGLLCVLTTSEYSRSVWTMEVNPNHPIITELSRRADEPDKTAKDLIWLMFDTSLLTFGFHLDEPTQFADRIHRTIKLGLCIDDEDEESSVQTDQEMWLICSFCDLALEGYYDEVPTCLDCTNEQAEMTASFMSTKVEEGHQENLEQSLDRKDSEEKRIATNYEAYLQGDYLHLHTYPEDAFEQMIAVKSKPRRRAFLSFLRARTVHPKRKNRW